MSLRLIGKKKGMTKIFDEEGNAESCTVIFFDQNFVTQIKTETLDGYSAIQMGSIAKKHPKKPEKGHCAKSNVAPCRVFIESKGLDVSQYTLGQKVDISHFSVGDYVDVTGISKGKGYQGVMKLHGFSGMRKSHGAGPTHRHGGSTGMRTTPGRCFPGGKRASHMGSDTVTVQNLLVMLVDQENQALVIRGAIPGANESVVFVTKAVKRG
ncbi:MAG: 50S ribosomal protein L3 [Parachlamydiales bacterium]|nr:50S ribosomal protein L3 [Parachlamydiales bacterium]